MSLDTITCFVHPGGKGGWVTPVRNQQRCGACVAFALTAAAETAMAAALDWDARTAPVLSVQDLFFCAGEDILLRTCYTGWKLEDAIQAIKPWHLTADKCRPYNVDQALDRRDLLCGNLAHAGSSCRVEKEATGRSFEYSKLGTDAQVKEAITSQGGVVTAMLLYPDFMLRARYEDAEKVGLEGSGVSTIICCIPRGDDCIPDLEALFSGWAALSPPE